MLLFSKVYVFINLCFTRNSTMWSLINVSSNLHTTDVKRTGLLSILKELFLPIVTS